MLLFTCECPGPIAMLLDLLNWLISGVRARAMMIKRGWNKCAFEQSRHLWVSSWILPLVSIILTDHVILIVLSLDDNSS